MANSSAAHNMHNNINGSGAVPLDNSDIGLVPSKSLTEFKLFSELPPELRSKVWELAASEPRSVKLSPGADKTNKYRRRVAFNQASSSIQGQRRHPAILHATFESRSEGLRHYAKCHEKPREKARKYITNTVFINFEVDKFIIDTYQVNAGRQCLPLTSRQNFDIATSEQIAARAQKIEIHVSYFLQSEYMYHTLGEIAREVSQVVAAYDLFATAARSIWEFQDFTVSFNCKAHNEHLDGIEYYRKMVEEEFIQHYRNRIKQSPNCQLLGGEDPRIPRLDFRIRGGAIVAMPDL